MHLAPLIYVSTQQAIIYVWLPVTGGACFSCCWTGLCMCPALNGQCEEAPVCAYRTRTSARQRANLRTCETVLALLFTLVLPLPFMYAYLNPAKLRPFGDPWLLRLVLPPVVLLGLLYAAHLAYTRARDGADKEKKSESESPGDAEEGALPLVGAAVEAYGYAAADPDPAGQPSKEEDASAVFYPASERGACVCQCAKYYMVTTPLFFALFIAWFRLLRSAGLMRGQPQQEPVDDLPVE